MNRQAVRLGLAGLGWIGRYYLAAATRLSGAEIVAVADPNAAAKASLAVPIPFYDSHVAMYGEENLDGVIISTPPVTHLDLSTFFLRRQIGVLCEKPFAVNLDAAVRMRREAIQSATPLLLATKYRFVDDVRSAKKLLKSGAVGDVISVEIRFTSHNDMAGRWNVEPEVSGGGVMIDNGSHAVDLAGFLLGPLETALMTPFASRPDIGVEESAVALFKPQSGCLVSVLVSWRIPRYADHYLEIHGTDGDIMVGWAGSRYRRAEGEWKHFGSGYEITLALAGQLQNFAACLRHEDTPRATAADGCHNVAAIDACYRSATVGCWQSLRSHRDCESRR